MSLPQNNFISYQVNQMLLTASLSCNTAVKTPPASKHCRTPPHLRKGQRFGQGRVSATPHGRTNSGNMGLVTAGPTVEAEQLRQQGNPCTMNLSVRYLAHTMGNLTNSAMDEVDGNVTTYSTQ
jgi:hypothetical protein